MTLAENMRAAWGDRAVRAFRIVQLGTVVARPLFKPDTVEQARRDFMRAQHEGRRWL